MENQVASKEWLVHGRIPDEMVREKWDKCFQLRQRDIKTSKTLAEILDLYPIIKHPSGGSLITSDFERLYPKASFNFYQQFPLLHDQIEPILRKANKSQKNELRYDLYKKCLVEQKIEMANLLLVYFLPLLIKTDYKIAGCDWRPSVKDAQKYFLTEVHTAGEINSTVETMMENLANLTKRKPLQPHILVIGPWENAAYMVIFGGSQFATQTVLDAVALCVQICFVLDLEYSPELLPTWLFIQVHLFQIKSKTAVPKSCLKLIKALGK